MCTMRSTVCINMYMYIDTHCYLQVRDVFHLFALPLMPFRVLRCKDYYDILGVSKEATEEEMKKNYKKVYLSR